MSSLQEKCLVYLLFLINIKIDNWHMIYTYISSIQSYLSYQNRKDSKNIKSIPPNNIGTNAPVFSCIDFFNKPVFTFNFIECLYATDNQNRK